jgi:hypothetical protein
MRSSSLPHRGQPAGVDTRRAVDVLRLEIVDRGGGATVDDLPATPRLLA